MYVVVREPRQFRETKCFSPFKNCFWRKGWRKNSEKNLTSSSHSDRPIKLVHVTIDALTGLKSRFCDIFGSSSCVLRTLKIVSGEGSGRKILEKIQGALLTWIYRSSY